ncbi:MAG: zinc ribbon domain-containing protein [Anaerolineales bacterium]|nr:zinc ribbon domain-containing protein [Anaerolineales bacterium]MCX7756149.1 zinc ribbon domain-containing protein [Anaerolineales bacterium]MDW8277633.1 zinc ribbon domain-containing protein [Anaerolineales bacterium]
MRRLAVFLAFMSFLLFPVSVRAQSQVTFERLTIELWPDFDQPSVLVLYDFVLAADTPLPSQVNIRMPAGAQLFAVAREEAQGLMNVEHAPPVQQGNYSVVTFVVTERLEYRVEFYVPYVQQEQRRTFIYSWLGDYPVAALTMVLQEPRAAVNIETDPEMTRRETRADGLFYRTFSVQNVAAGERVALKVGYDNPASELTAPRPAPVTSLEPSAPLVSILPWMLGGLGLVLMIGGGVWYWLSGRSTFGTSRSRKRHAVSAEEKAADTVYCTQCGKRAQSGDRFCRACGARLRV